MSGCKPRDWKLLADKVAKGIPREKLHPDVLGWLEVHRGEKWLIAFSGGADSLLLLLLLWGHWPAQRKRLVAVHFNHRLRGAASRQDQEFCRRIARGLGIPFDLGTWDKPRPEGGEAAARGARHAFFKKRLQVRRARALWLGHQQEDVAETLLMRLSRGSGTAGLSAPRPVQSMPDGIFHLRPLLTLHKKQIRDQLQACGAAWREDKSNQSPRFFRNRVRHEVIPVWQNAAGRDAMAGAALSRQLLSDDDQALETWLDAIAPMSKNGSLSLRRLAGKPRGIVRRAMHRWLNHHGIGSGISRQAFEALLEDVLRARVTRHSIGAGIFAKITRLSVNCVRGEKMGLIPKAGQLTYAGGTSTFPSYPTF
jgi:tRNA(Ile)-lysidine synthase